MIEWWLGWMMSFITKLPTFHRIYRPLKSERFEHLTKSVIYNLYAYLKLTNFLVISLPSFSRNKKMTKENLQQSTTENHWNKWKHWYMKYFRNHPLSTNEKYSKKLTFLTAAPPLPPPSPPYTRTCAYEGCACINGYGMLPSFSGNLACILKWILP